MSDRNVKWLWAQEVGTALFKISSVVTLQVPSSIHHLVFLTSFRTSELRKLCFNFARLVWYMGRGYRGKYRNVALDVILLAYRL